MWSYSVFFCAQFIKPYVAGSVPNCKYTNIRKAVYAGMIIFQTEFIQKKSRKRCSMRKEFYVQKIFEESYIKYSYLGDTQRTLIWALRNHKKKKKSFIFNIVSKIYLTREYFVISVNIILFFSYMTLVSHNTYFRKCYFVHFFKHECHLQMCAIYEYWNSRTRCV